MSNTRRFVHLNVHSDYSLEDSTLGYAAAIASAEQHGMGAIGLSDVNNMFAAVRFFKKASSAGIKPIISSKIYVHDDLSRSTPSEPYPLIAIARNNEGYQNLCRLTSLVYSEGQVGPRARVSLSTLRDNSRGLLLLSGGREGQLGRLILAGKDLEAKAFCSLMSRTFGEQRFFIEVQRVGHPDDNRYNERALELCERFGLSPVATNNVRFLTREDYETHQIRVCIGKKMQLDHYDRQSPYDYTPQQYLRSPEEMRELFDDIPIALDNAVAIADGCDVNIELGKNYLPAYPTEDGVSESEYLNRQSLEGLKARLSADFGVGEGDYSKYQSYFDRLDFENGVINKMGFPGYFLIVSDFIKWAKDNKIPVGPGRGSGAGSLVAYSLGITDLDPMKYDLLFERFLNPERVSMPDFDVDFCMDRRDEVIRYVADKYGHNSVSQIITFGTLAAKSSIKDVSRVLGYSFGMGARLSQMVPDRPDATLTSALEESGELKQLMSSDPDVSRIMKHALALEGKTRQTGKHAGGVLIAPGDLRDYTPTYSEPDGSGFVSQYDKGDVEDAGLVKFDFLGLRTLTIISKAVDLIEEKEKKKFDLLKIPLDDAGIYDMLQKGDTTAVFQVESRGMKDLLRRLKPDCFEDLVALVALFRPGPLQSGMVDNFINRKHGREEISYPDAKYQHESLKDILEPTYGIILYQEQVMQIAQAMAGYSLGQADLLRRAMGKKKIEEMQKQEEAFVKGAINNGIDELLSRKIFNLVEKFAGYGFNKSHSAAYALISYQTAYIKHYYPAQFMSAVMSSVMHDTQKVVPFFRETRNLGLEVDKPSINISRKEFYPSDGCIYYGLGAVKGLGNRYLDQMLQERAKNGPYGSVFDWIYRTNPSKTVVEAAIRSGSLDEFGISRASLFETYPEWKVEAKKSRDTSSSQIDIFSIPGKSQGVEPRTAPDWPVSTALAGERKTLGVFISAHPLDDYKDLLGKVVSTTLYDAMSHGVIDGDAEIVSDRPVTVSGYIDNLDIRQGRKGTRASLILDDGTAQIPAMIFPETFHKFQHVIQPDATVLIKGKIVRDKITKSDKLIAFNVQSIDMLRDKEISKVSFSLGSKEANKSDHLKSIMEMISSCPDGFTRVGFTGADNSFVQMGDRSIRVSDELMNRLRCDFGSQNVTPFFRSMAPDERSSSDVKKEGDLTREKRLKEISLLFREAELSMN